MVLLWLALHFIGPIAQPPSPFLTGPSSAPPLTIATQYLHEHAGELGLSALNGDLDDVVVSSETTSEHNGVKHLYLRQRHRGIDINGADVNFNIARDGRIISMGGRFVGNVAASASAPTPSRDAIAATRAAAAALRLRTTARIRIAERKGGPAHETVLTGGGISMTPIPARLVYHSVTPTTLRLAWQLEIQEPGGQHWWVMTVDAASLAILNKFDRVTRSPSSA